LRPAFGSPTRREGTCTAGVAVNVGIGYALTAHVFAPYWDSLGQA
jgi:hypothetical protein